MRRLSIFVKNKTEMIGNAAQLGVAVLYPDSLEKSGLSCAEIYHLEQWVQGTGFVKAVAAACLTESIYCLTSC
jgi:hypothetical protein